MTCKQSKLPYRNSSSGKQVHTPYIQRDDAGPTGGIGGSNPPSGGSIGGGSTGGGGSFHDQPHLGPDHGNIIPQPQYDPYVNPNMYVDPAMLQDPNPNMIPGGHGGYGGNSYVP